MRNAFIRGIGQVPVAKHDGKSIGDLVGAASRQAMADAGVSDVDAVYIGNMFAGEATGQSHLGPLVGEIIGQGKGHSHMECVMVNAACASGAAAVRQAYLAVAGGAHDTVLAVGVEKMSGIHKDLLTGLLAMAADLEREIVNEATFLGLNALLMRRYLYEYGLGRDQFSIFSEVAHQNALHNPNARLHEAVSHADYVNSRMVADPIALHDCCPTGDGAAALVISRGSRRRNSIHITGSACATDSLSLQEREDPLWLQAAHDSSRRALAQAGRVLSEIDFFEAHDAFTIMAALSLEAVGFAERGRGIEFAREEGIGLRGALPMSTMGGLKARGHPVGASGVYQIVEAVLQLRNHAGPNQISSPSVALTQSFGGTAATAITHVLERSKN